MSSTDKFRFGNGTCSTIEVDKFSPICDHPGVSGSSPLNLDVPIPVFHPVVPPIECACFTFVPTTADVTVTRENDPGKITGRATVEITQKDDDCCSGKYEITPTITIDVADCMEKDWSVSKTYEFNRTDAGYSGSFTVTLKMKDCVPSLEITGTKLTVPQPPPISIPPVCLKSVDPFNLNIKYYDRKNHGNTEQTETKSVTLTADNTGECKTFTVEDVTLDLTAMSSIANGGSVFQDGDGNLYTDGSYGGQTETTWYGGGIGNIPDNNAADSVVCRGPLMRSAPDGKYPFDTAAQHLVPHIALDGKFKITDKQGSEYAFSWVSWCAKDEEDGEKSIQDESGEEGVATGNLDMVLPSGFQWHERGIAINLTQFNWNPSGILNFMSETNTGVLISPSPALHVGGDLDGMNASGLAMQVEDTALYPIHSLESTVSDGLMVSCGFGMRVFATDSKTSETAAQLRAIRDNSRDRTRIGALEVYGHKDDFNFNTDDKMVLNDEKTDTWSIIPDDINPVDPSEYDGDGAMYGRGAESTDYAMMVGMPLINYGWDNYRGWMYRCSMQTENRTTMDALTTAHNDLLTLVSSLRPNGTAGAAILGAISSVNNQKTALNGTAADLRNLANRIAGGSYSQVSDVAAAVSDLAGAVSSLASAVPAALGAVANAITTFNTPLTNNVTKLADAVGAIKPILNNILKWCGGWNCAYVHVGKAGMIMAVNDDLERPAKSLRHYDHPTRPGASVQ